MVEVTNGGITIGTCSRRTAAVAVAVTVVRVKVMERKSDRDKKRWQK